MTTPKSFRVYLAKIGRKGGRASQRRLTADQRRENARRAARARWARRATKA